GIAPGLWGYEAGQSGVGDIFAWFTRTSVPASYAREAEERGLSLHDLLTEKASGQRVGEHGLVALDWHHGNRYALVDHDLSGAVFGLTLATKPEDVYLALLESTAFGTRLIIETMQNAGLAVDEVIVAGGLLKNRFLMQLYADITRKTLSVLRSDQGPALGSAIHAAVAAGVYPDIRTASEAMGKVERAVYVPNQERADGYDALYAEYRELHDHFGRGGADVLPRRSE